MLAWPGKEWTLPRTAEGGAAHVYDVAIVGGGQCGMAVAFGLAREKVCVGAAQHYQSTSLQPSPPP